ncbi:Bcr/CflA subfamily drug resistance transporter [Neorhizobium sp. R1-B]|uniref:multidrug effflux MFS transporter n=2 Tax=Neorhizobium TaxID=1525371 RepID=UPI000CF9CBDF|nr:MULTISPECIES: multidrug effflux MFS transporter [unclassified Neorhizobium]TCV69377.1 Bcr/CflA subfamily drug resistance transporter [Neorhizobium sp. S3-V5DH]TDX83616.1 Bcr/CflA subfamily drug resistance transporter [Neorhizobium sp. R1-B]
MMRSPPRFSTIILLCALSVIPLNVFLPSLANIAGDFHISYAFASLSLAGYAVVAVAVEMVMGPLSDRFGRRPIILANLAAFTLGSIGCALSPDIWIFLAFRMLQATITSCYPVAMAVIRDTVGKERTASRIGYTAMIWAIAPMFAPAFGGALDQALGWRAIFWCLALAGAVMFLLCWFGLSETNKARSDTIAQQFRTYPALFRAPRFWAYGLCMSFSVGAFYAFLAGAPLAATSAYDLQAGTLGIFMGVTTLGYIFGSFLSGRYAGRVPLTTMMIMGRVVACACPIIGLALFLAGFRNAIALFGPCILIGIGNGLTMPSANAGMLSVRPDLAGSAAGLAGAMTVGGGAALSSITGAMLTENDATYGLFCIILLSTTIGLLAATFAALTDKHDSTITAVKSSHAASQSERG